MKYSEIYTALYRRHHLAVDLDIMPVPQDFPSEVTCASMANHVKPKRIVTEVKLNVKL
jgi:hypothetical protein